MILSVGFTTNKQPIPYITIGIVWLERFVPVTNIFGVVSKIE